MTWRPPDPLPILIAPALRANGGGPFHGCFTTRDASTALEMLDHDWPPLVDLATRIVAHLGLDLAIPGARRPIPLAIWLVQRAVLVFAAELRQAAPDRGRAFLDHLLADADRVLPGLRVVAEEGVWHPLLALPLPVFLDCRTAPRVAYAPPDPGEVRALRARLLSDLPALLRRNWGLEA